MISNISSLSAAFNSRLLEGSFLRILEMRASTLRCRPVEFSGVINKKKMCVGLPSMDSKSTPLRLQPETDDKARPVSFRLSMGDADAACQCRCCPDVRVPEDPNEVFVTDLGTLLPPGRPALRELLFYPGLSSRRESLLLAKRRGFSFYVFPKVTLWECCKSSLFRAAGRMPGRRSTGVGCRGFSGSYPACASDACEG